MKNPEGLHSCSGRVMFGIAQYLHQLMVMLISCSWGRWVRVVISCRMVAASRWRSVGSRVSQKGSPSMARRPMV